MSEIDEKAYQYALRNAPDPCSTHVFVEHYEQARIRQPDYQRVIEKIEAIHGYFTKSDIIKILKEAGE